MGLKIEEMITKYSEPEVTRGAAGSLVQISVRVPEEIKMKIEILSSHCGIKKSPFLNELLVSAVNDFWDRSTKHIPDDVLHFHSEDVDCLIQEDFISHKERGGDLDV